MSLMPLRPGQPGYKDTLGAILGNAVAPMPRMSLEQLAGNAPMPTADLGTPMAPQKPGFMAPGSKAAMIAGIIGDTLASVSGGQPIFTQNMMAERQRKAQADAAEAQWGLHRQAANQDWLQHQQYENEHRPDDEFTRMVRASGVDPASPQGQALYQQRIQRQTAEPDVVVTLPNGQLYIGPKSGLGTALGGGVPPVAPPPKNELTPITGGGVGNGTGGFPYR